MATKGLVSGVFSICHAGHIKFFQQAKQYCDHLTVCIASDETILKYKDRIPVLPEKHRQALITSIKYVDEVRISRNSDHIGLNFFADFIEIKPDFLIVTIDDTFKDDKVKLCADNNCKYLVLDKDLEFDPISTTQMRNKLMTPREVPLRIDFLSNWLDHPDHCVEGGFIVNCTITPMFNLNNKIYRTHSGLGMSAAIPFLKGENSLESELKAGVGFQDPVVIAETGFCVWKSHKRPELYFKYNPSFLKGRILLKWTEGFHNTPELANIIRDYQKAALNSKFAVEALQRGDFDKFFKEYVNNQYKYQLDEGMKELPNYKGVNITCKKYGGAGHGGYAFYILDTPEDRDKLYDKLENENIHCIKVEPYMKEMY